MATIAERENQDSIKLTHNKGKLVVTKLRKPVNQEPRKTLQTIQLSSHGDGQMIGKENLKDPMTKCKEKIQLNKGSLAQPLQIYNDPSPPLHSTPTRASLSDISTQTDVSEEQVSPIDKEAFDLMVNDDVPQVYWEEVAEQRRRALSEALNENEELHTSICELKEENERLSKLASKTEYLAEVIKSFIGTEDDEDEVAEEEAEGDGETEKTESEVVIETEETKPAVVLESAPDSDNDTETESHQDNTEHDEHPVQLNSDDVSNKNETEITNNKQEEDEK